MIFRLSIWRPTKESVLCEQFLAWQKIPFERFFGPETLGKANGQNVPVLEEDFQVVAKGFFEIIKFFEKKGMILC